MNTISHKAELTFIWYTFDELSSKKNNEILRKPTEPRTNRKIIAITKTNLFSAQHYNAAIAKYFHNYNTHRAGRETKYNPEDDYQLLDAADQCWCSYSASLNFFPMALVIS